jgi:hypothetical protein
MNTINAYQTYPPLIFYEFSQSEIVCKMVFDGASQGYRTTRIFSKLQDLFTRIGGTINSFWVGGVIINYFISECFFINYFYEFFNGFERKTKQSI